MLPLPNYFQGLEAEIRARDHGILGTNAAVGKLEVHNVTSLQDLRGRIVRCDASIAKHSSDIKTCFGDIQRVINDQYKAHTAVQEVVHKMESQVSNTNPTEQETFIWQLTIF